MRGPTAFFLFSEEKREQARAECVAAAEAGAKISVAVVASAIGEKWRALTDAEKAEYQEKASQRAKQLAESAAAAAENEAGESAEGGSPGKENEHKAEQEANAHPFGFPLSLVKRVMCLDPEVARVSGDGLKAVAKAAELMLGDMAAKACAAAQGQKRKTIKLGDIGQTVRRDRRLVEVGLKDILGEDIFREAKAPLRDAANGTNAAAGKDEAGGAGTPASQKPAPCRKKAREAVDVARPITDFFSK